MSAGASHHKKARLEMLEGELAHLEALPPVKIRTGLKRAKTVVHTPQQFKRIEALRTKHIPKARQRVDAK